MALEALYELDVRGDECLDGLEEFLAESGKPPLVLDFARELVLGTWRARERYDARIARALIGWDLPRLSPVDRSILRLGTHELCAAWDPPAEVAIDEAVKLANKYSSAESGGLINGVLDAIRRDPGEAAGATDAPTERTEPTEPATT